MAMNFMEELKNVDPKTPGSWPWPIKIGAFIAYSGRGSSSLAQWPTGKEEWASYQGFKQEETASCGKLT
jgi:hypothetical protein